MIEQTVDTKTTASVAASLFDLCVNVAANVKTDDGKPFNHEAFNVMLASMFIRRLYRDNGAPTALAFIQVTRELIEHEEQAKTNKAHNLPHKGRA
jgi:hypothetical protein